MYNLSPERKSAGFLVFMKNHYFHKRNYVLLVTFWCIMSVSHAFSWRDATQADYPHVYLNSSFHAENLIGNSGWSGNFTFSPTAISGRYPGIEGSEFISPELDLLAAECPSLIIYGPQNKSFTVFVSNDGIHYKSIATTLNTKSRLPKDTKRIKIESCTGTNIGISCIQILNLDESSSREELKDITQTILSGDDRGYAVLDEASGLYIRDVSITSNTLLALKSSRVYCSGYTFDFFYKVGEEYIKGNNDSYKFSKNGSYHYLIPAHTSEIRLYHSDVSQFYAPSKVSVYDNSYNTDGSWDTGIFTNDISAIHTSYYDIDGDGIMEYQHNSALYDFQKGFLNNISVASDFAGFTGWINYNNDDHIDYYYNEGVPAYIAKGGDAFNFTQVYSRTDNKYLLNPIDYNNDGKTEFLEKNGNDADTKSHNTLVLDNEGNWQNEKIRVMTFDEYNGIKKKVESTGGMVIPGMQDMYAPIISAAPSSFGNYNAIDINSDGLTDFVDTSLGCYFLNTGENSFVEGKFGGQVTFRDFNNDGLTDRLTYDENTKTMTLCLAQKEGKANEVQLFSGLYCSDKIWCYDFDKDGDIDILVPFDFTTNQGSFKNGASYLVMIENKGNGSFKKHETYLEGEVYSYYCMDIDGDGCYEVVSKKSTDEVVGKDDRYNTDLYGIDYVAYKISGMDVSAEPILLKRAGTIYSDQKGRYWDDQYPFLIADIDNSGLLKCLYMTEYANHIFQISDKVNSVPQKMSKPNFVYEAASGMLKISWEAGTDTESSSSDLTYALRIGTAPDQGDILYVHALPNGARRNLLDGNNGYNTVRTLNTTSWPAGKYYISVQSIDPNHRGSEFSEYAIFEKKEPDNGFVISYKQPFAVGDVCKVTLTNKALSSNIYNWDFDGAEILNQSEDKSSYELRFKDSGEKRIALQVSDSKGNLSNIVEQFINVTSGNIKPGNILLDDNTALTDVGFALDMDEDGISEIYYNDEHRFMQGNDNGVYTKIKKIFNSNSNLYIEKAATIDLNNDGLCDIFGTSNTKTLVKVINEGDKDLSVETPTTLSTPGWESMYDFDNDGLYDIKQYYNRTDLIYKNTGDYINFETVNYGASSIAGCNDYNNHGLTDLLIPVYKWDDNTQTGVTDYVVYQNNGDWTFTPASTLHSITTIDKNSDEFKSILLIDDFDGDGKTDFFIQKEQNNVISYSIEWGDKDVTNIDFPKEISYISAFDLDNNGCRDLRICEIKGSQGVHEAYAIYMYPNHQYKIDNVSGTESDFEIDNYYNFYTGTPVFYRSDGTLSLNVNILKGNNSIPQAPGNLRASQTKKGVMIEWDHSADQETPAKLMRYNISIKRKGMEGDNAYLISPCNSAKNNVHIPSDKPLIPNNRYFIPIANIAPGEYEIQVQGIDGWYMQSDFSEVYNLAVTETLSMEMPASTSVDTDTKVIVSGNIAADINWDGAIVKSQDKDSYTIAWNTPGMKTVVFRNFTQQIYVHEKPEGAFSLPESAIANSTIRLTAANASGSLWEVSTDGTNYETIGENPVVHINVIDDDSLTILFTKVGKYHIRHTVSDEFCTVAYDDNITITDEPTTQEISVITVDANTGKHLISWDEPTHLPTGVESVNVYKETSRLNEYKLIANVPLGTGYYVDPSSVPEMSASRYRLSWVLSFGESELSKAHQSIHVLINRGIGDSWNLMWSKYEGRDIESYRILRGTSPENMTIVSEVSGHMCSYSDMAPMTGNALYYAVETVPATAISGKSYLKAADTSAKSRSNIVSIINAAHTDFITDIVIKGENEENEIFFEDKETLKLTAFVYPNTATFQRLNWLIVTGEDIATIDRNGLLTAKEGKSGTVTVRAYAIDGSGVYGEINVTVTGNITRIEPVSNDKEHRLSVYPSFVDYEVNIKGIPQTDSPTKIYIFNSNGEVLYIKEVYGNKQITVDCSGFNAGVYFVKVVSGNISMSERFIKK